MTAVADDDDSDPRYSALLIGSWEGDSSRSNRDNSDKRVDEKGGIKDRYKYKGVQVPYGQWAKGDLADMKRLMRLKKIGVFSELNYVEQREDGHHANGKVDILDLIDVFFKQDGKTHFVLYFTGHGAVGDGSWCFAVRDSISAVSNCGHNPEDGSEGPAHATREDSGASGGASNIGLAGQTGSRVPPNKKLNDFVEFNDVISKWDKNKRGREDRFLMMVLDCCHAGSWVEMLNEAVDRAENAAAATPEQEQERVRPKRRDDICIQASCRLVEKSMVAKDQQSSDFTRAFVAAQNRSTFKKLLLSALDHMFVLNLLCFHSFRSTPASSKNAPSDFCGLKVFDSFDDMHLKT